MRTFDDSLASERHFRLLAENAPIGVFEEDGRGNCLYVNRRWQEITGLVADQALGRGWEQLLDEEDLADLTALPPGRQDQDGDRRVLRLRMRRPDGGRPWVEIAYSTRVSDLDGAPVRVGTLEDITESVDNAERVQRITHAIESTNDLVGLYSFIDGSIYLNEAARRFFGLGEVVEAGDVPIVAPPNVMDHWPDDILPALADQGIWSGEIEATDATGRVTPLSAVMTARLDENGTLVGVSSICRDISERKALEASLEHHATHDPLTGLPNRLLLLDRLEMALERAERNGTQVGVLFLDLDRFKVVNDSLGHGLGDRVLVALADRLALGIRPGDTLARFGGDEFVVLAEDVTRTEEAEVLAGRLSALLAEPLEIGDVRLVASVSTGITLGGAGATPATLIRDADAAMYRAKARGGSRHQVFDAQTRSEAVDRLDIESALRRAIATEELRVHYQPKVHLATGHIVGVEALIRWQHPTRGLLLPDQFLRIAEESHLLFDVGTWMFRQAIAALPRLDAARPAGTPPIYLCANVSQPELADPRLADLLIGETRRHGVDPAQIDLELTEHTLMEDVSSTADVLRRLKAHGFKLAVDDFGTGYSSLAYLRHFPVDLLKIDKTFVEGLGHVAADRAIVSAVTTLARSMDLQVVAEGVETAEQLAELRDLGCTMAQGFYMSPGLPLDEIEQLIAADPVW